MAQLYLPDEDSELVTANRKPVRNFWMFWKKLAQAVPSSGAAPADAEYLVGAADATLTAERVVTDTATVTWDLSTPGQAKANAVNSGTVTVTGSPANGDLTRFSGPTSITKWVSAALSVIGRGANSTGSPADIVASADQQILGRRSSAVGFTAIEDFGYWSPLTNGKAPLDIEDIGYWSPLTNGDAGSPELIFADGDTIDVWVSTSDGGAALVYDGSNDTIAVWTPTP